MSRETQEWLSTNVLVGFTGKRGNAWHYRQGDENHYVGAIPVADVERRLFSWEPVSHLLKCPCGCGDVTQIVSRSDNRHRMGIFSESYQPHPYRPWLLNNVSAILGDTMQIGSAGLLKGGAVAWVSVEVPDNIRTPEGVEFRPHLLATTSFDGSTATTYKRVVTNVVCDNTRDAALGEKGQVYRVKHTKYSQAKEADARVALEMVHDIADEYASEVKELCATTVTDRQWFRFLDTFIVTSSADSQRAKTTAQNKRDALNAMYKSDARAADWQGTAFGVVQAVDTWFQHVASIRGAMRAERNMLNVISGKTAETDREALAVLRKVLANV
jgi:phage/plasmid-like protein (TIGR03299 family)